MANKISVSGQDARDKLVAGIQKTASVVGSTLGPKGRYVGIDSSWGEPKITKDGVTVNNNFGLSDIFENFGAKLAKHTAKKTDESVGDGTTTTNILFGAIVTGAHKACTAGAKASDVRRGISLGAEKAVAALSTLQRDIQSHEEIAQVGTISANGEREIGEKIAEAMEKVGKDGIITVEEGKGLQALELDVVDGYQFDRGYCSSYFATNKEKMIAELDSPYILVMESKLSGLQPILPVLEAVVQAGKSLLIVAEDVEGEALATLVLNKLRGQLRVVAVKAPGFGDRRKEMLADIATLTGGQIISDDCGIKLESVTLEMLGRARKIKASKDSTTIIEGAGSVEDVKARSMQIKSLIEDSTSDYDREKLQERLAKLSGGVAIIKVGGATEVEVKERKDRVDDALNSTRAAVEEGIVPGGGVALLRAAEVLDTLKGDNDDENIGIRIVASALEAPVSMIAKNAGVEGAVIVAKLREQSDKNVIFDASKMTYVNAFDSGIIDPLKVVRVALQDAASVASQVVSTEAILAEEKDLKEDAMAGAGGGMGGF